MGAWPGTCTTVSAIRDPKKQGTNTLFEICLNRSGRDIDDTREPENFVFLRGVSAHFVEVVVEFRQSPHELISGIDALQLRRDERFCPDGLVAVR